MAPRVAREEQPSERRCHGQQRERRGEHPCAGHLPEQERGHPRHQREEHAACERHARHPSEQPQTRDTQGKRAPETRVLLHRVHRERVQPGGAGPFPVVAQITHPSNTAERLRTSGVDGQCGVEGGHGVVGASLPEGMPAVHGVRLGIVGGHGPRAGERLFGLLGMARVIGRHPPQTVPRHDLRLERAGLPRQPTRLFAAPLGEQRRRKIRKRTGVVGVQGQRVPQRSLGIEVASERAKRAPAQTESNSVRGTSRGVEQRERVPRAPEREQRVHAACRRVRVQLAPPRGM